MITLRAFAEKHSLKGEIAAKMCFTSSFDDSSDKNRDFLTGAGILADCYGKIDYFISPVNNVRLFNATASILKAYNKKIRITAVNSGILPDGVDLSLIDDAVNVLEQDANKYKDELFETEQLVIGPLSGAALKAAADTAGKIKDEHARIVVLFPDIFM